MSFSQTVEQIIDRTKDVTRRLGWENLRAGDQFGAVRKSMGLKRGEKIEVLDICEVVSVRRERLQEITLDDVRREGFPGMSVADFIAYFCKAFRVKPRRIVTRIEFRYV